MKTIKLAFIAIVGSLLSTSCLVDDEAQSQNQAETEFTVGFERSSVAHILTPSDTEDITDTMHVELVGGNGGVYSSSDLVVKYEVDASSTLDSSLYTITSPTSNFTIPAGREVANEMLSYSIHPTNVPLGESTIVLNLVHVSGDASIGGLPFGQLVINVSKCDPPLSGTYTNSENGNIVTITATGCNTYRADYLTPFASTYWWDFTHNADDSITIDDWEFMGSNPFTIASGTVLGDGTISVTGATVAGVPWYVDLAWTLTPQ